MLEPPGRHTSSTSRSAHGAVVAATAALAAGLLLTACGGGESGATANTVAKPVQRAAPAATVAVPVGPPGQTVYMDACARCHGADLLGRGGTPALSSYRIASLGDQTMRLAIQYGKGEMPAFGGLTTTQIDDLISYLRTL